LSSLASLPAGVAGDGFPCSTTPFDAGDHSPALPFLCPFCGRGCSFQIVTQGVSRLGSKVVRPAVWHAAGECVFYDSNDPEVFLGAAGLWPPPRSS
jgi:hypothetical protein